ncbi:hypothetical protein RJT34_22935 [Clitoria ternatea]|uniref:Uncharacterized GPI-anchored protein At5g19230-like domain-containing protein n=1 Tax=Clitoria ternatea TaxID=43366 RepID=A0AAN9IKZ2_CLITE
MPVLFTTSARGQKHNNGVEALPFTRKCNLKRSSRYIFHYMASSKLGLYLLIIATVFDFNLFPNAQAYDDKEKNLLHDINTYRKTLNLPVLGTVDKVSCLAVEIAEDLKDKHCEEFRDYYPVPGTNSKIPNFQKNVKQCKININNTKDGVIMPVCLPKLDPDYLFSNYTKSNRFTKYLNNSKYNVAGIGSEDHWMVLIISSNTTSSGDFSSATSLFSHPFMCRCLFLAFFVTKLIFFWPLRLHLHVIVNLKPLITFSANRKPKIIKHVIGTES